MHHSNTIVVVGARVAGAATALHLARRGHRVVILDRNGPPADTTSTHLLMRAGVFHLERLGVLDQVVNADTPLVRDIRLGFGDQLIDLQVSPAYGVDAFMAPRRTVLDTILLEEAIMAGAEFYRGVTVTGVLTDRHGRVVGVSGRDDSRRAFRLPAGWVVGADGRRSTLASLVDAATLESHAAPGGAVYAYFQAGGTPRFDLRFTPGWGFTAASTNGGEVVAVSYAPSNGGAQTEELFWRGVEVAAPDRLDHQRQGHRGTRFHHVTRLTNSLRHPYGAGWALVGDAGFSKDPQTAHGITSAMRDAELCADAIDRAVSGEGDGGFSQFQSVRDHFARPLLHHGNALGAFEWDLAEASAHMRALGKLNDAACEYFEASGMAAA